MIKFTIVIDEGRRKKWSQNHMIAWDREFNKDSRMKKGAS